MNKAPFKWVPFSKKQKKVLTWWMNKSPHKDKDVLICDGSVRAGKTVVMSFSFILWAMATFSLQNFGLSGKTIGSFRRNVLFFLKIALRLRGYKVEDKRADNLVIVSKGEVTNYFYIFGGKDERSQDLVQGITAAGFFFDEVALMPESFVNQATARCSVDGAKLWFNCNPEGPYHWFKVNWLDKLIEKNALHIHFTMDDNPSLSDRVKERYKRMYSGVFFQRYILGMWVVAEGIIYDMFNHDSMVVNELPNMFKTWVGVDYGQSNATTFILCGLGEDGKFYIIDEYYHSGRESGTTKSPKKYSVEFKKWLEKQDYKPKHIFIDPSAKGFILQLWEEGIRNIQKADNDVLRGIELTSSIIENDIFRVHKRCKHVLKELSSYTWDPKAQERGEDKPIKDHDHTLDGIRYVANGTRMIWQKKLAR